MGAYLTGGLSMSLISKSSLVLEKPPFEGMADSSASSPITTESKYTTLRLEERHMGWESSHIIRSLGVHGRHIVQ